MSDDIALSSRPSRSWRRERVLRATRQRLKRLEIEAHRIKAELARLESENETDIADELTQELQLEGAATARPLQISHLKRADLQVRGILTFYRRGLFVKQLHWRR